MRLFHFKNEMYQFIIFSPSFTDALARFEYAVADLYGGTLQRWELSSEPERLTVFWQEEGETAVNKDVFHVAEFPENTLVHIALCEEPAFLFPAIDGKGLWQTMWN